MLRSALCAARLQAAGMGGFAAMVGTATASLWAATLGSGVLGLAFWWAGARALHPADLGVQWAAVNLATLIGTLSTLGAGSALIRYLPSASPRQRAQELRGAIAMTAGGSAASGVAALLSLPALVPGAPGFARPAAAALFWTDILATGMGALGDEAALPFGRSRIIAERAFLLGAARIALLASLLATGAGWPLLAADCLGSVAGACYGWARLLWAERGSIDRSAWGVRLRLGFAAGSWLPGTLLVLPGQAMAAVSAHVLGPAGAGAMGPAWSLVLFSRAFPTAMATAVYAAAARRGTQGIPLGAIALAGAGIAAAFGLVICVGGLASFMLLGKDYRAAGHLLWWTPALLAAWYLLALLVVRARLAERPWSVLPAALAFPVLTMSTAPALTARLDFHGVGAAYLLGLAAATAIGTAAEWRRSEQQRALRGERTW